MRYVIFILLNFGYLLFSSAQFNMTQLGFLDIPAAHSNLNGIWGYTDETGKEYALVGTETGVSIVDISIPSNPTEILFIPGMTSIWREIKTNGDYAYVTTEAEEGLLIIDLSPLPGSFALPTNYYTGPSSNEWLTAHSLYADNGYLYINGAGRGNGGLIILDVATNPMNPIEVGFFDNWYVHDCYVRDDTAYLAHIYDGFFSIVDVTNKTSPVLLGSASTPTNFTHNIWTSTDGNFAFTTDEVSGGFIGSFDVTDPTNIKYLDKIQSSAGSGIVPHNSHVNGNYLVTSYYSDGVVIHDITHPHNMVEVGNFDTNPHAFQSTEGCWGVYPYFPSGNIIASDRAEGLFVLFSSVSPAAYLEGTITEQGTGNPINAVTVSIVTENITDNSNALGAYATGVAEGGTYDISYFKVLYYPQTISTNLTNGVVSVQDVVLEKIPQFFVDVKVLDAVTLNPIENAQVKFQHTYISHDELTDANGDAQIGLYYQDNYDIYVGKWGYETTCFIDSLITNSAGTITIYINEGIYDDFTFDFGWTSAGNAARGFWVRDIPVGTMDNAGSIENPYNDIPWDCGDFAYMTGNGTSAFNTDEVNDGEVVLISPVFDLTGYSNPHINFASWFYCQHGYTPENDTLKFFLFDGTNMVVIEKKFNGNTNMSYWIPNSIRVSDFITPSSSMQLIVTLSDELITENITEGGLDNFSITDFSMVSIQKEEQNEITVFPNPFNNELNIVGLSDGQVDFFDISGRLVLSSAVKEKIDVSDLQPGVYFLVFSDANNQRLETIKIIKQ